MGEVRKREGAEATPQYSILLPTYNERENLPICIWLIEKALADIPHEVLSIQCSLPMTKGGVGDHH